MKNGDSLVITKHNAATQDSQVFRSCVPGPEDKCHTYVLSHSAEWQESLRKDDNHWMGYKRCGILSYHDEKLH